MTSGHADRMYIFVAQYWLAVSNWYVQLWMTVLGFIRRHNGFTFTCNCKYNTPNTPCLGCQSANAGAQGVDCSFLIPINSYAWCFMSLSQGSAIHINFQPNQNITFCCWSITCAQSSLNKTIFSSSNSSSVSVALYVALWGTSPTITLYPPLSSTHHYPLHMQSSQTSKSDYWDSWIFLTWDIWSIWWTKIMASNDCSDIYV